MSEDAPLVVPRVALDISALAEGEIILTLPHPLLPERALGVVHVLSNRTTLGSS